MENKLNIRKKDRNTVKNNNVKNKSVKKYLLQKIK